MSDPIRIEESNVSLSTSMGDVSAKPRSDMPFKMLIMGDFSGRSNRGEGVVQEHLSGYPFYPVDRDNDEEVMKLLGVRLSLSMFGENSPSVELVFHELDDFHPDQIFARSEIFKALRDTRKRLGDPETFARTAAQLRGEEPEGGDKQSASGAMEATPGIRDRHPTSNTELLDQVLAVSAGPAPVETAATAPADEWDRFLGDIVRPHLVPDITQEQEALIASVDAAIAALMGAILHHPDFQDLEATWRGLRFLVRRLETNNTLKLVLMDISQQELVAQLTAVEELQETVLYKELSALSRAGSEEESWSVMAGMYSFEKNIKDAVTLARMGGMGELLRAPFIAGADLGCVDAFVGEDPPGEMKATRETSPENEKAWQVIRTLPEAAWIGLALPRFLIRLPYGADTDPLDSFDFEEMSTACKHSDYLWANAVVACLLLLGTTFSKHGWDFSDGVVQDVPGLPVHILRVDGETRTKPCAEVLLTQQAVEKIAGDGFMVLISFKDQDRIRLSRFQSIAQPAALLSGRWA